MTHHLGHIWPVTPGRCPCGRFYGPLTGKGRSGLRYRRCPSCDSLEVVLPLAERVIIDGREVVQLLHPRQAEAG